MEMFATSAVTLPDYYTINIPQSGGRAYLFDEIEIPAGTVSEQAWYTFFIPQDSLSGSTSRMTQIEFGTTDTYGTTINMESTVYDFGLISYSGSVFDNTDYRVYTTWTDTPLRKDNTSNDFFFRGGTVT